MSSAITKKIGADAEAYFRSGGYYCSEAIVASVRDNVAPDMDAGLIAAASGFPVGVGKSKCMCGAVSGAVLAMGWFFGRREPSNPKDPVSVKCLQLANELQEAFRTSHRVLCCHVLTQGFDMAAGEHRDQCISFTGEMAEKLAEILEREDAIPADAPVRQAALAA